MDIRIAGICFIFVGLVIVLALYPPPNIRDHPDSHKATRAGERIILTGLIFNWFRPEPSRALTKQFAHEGRGTQDNRKFVYSSSHVTGTQDNGTLYDLYRSYYDYCIEIIKSYQERIIFEECAWKSNVDMYTEDLRRREIRSLVRRSAGPESADLSSSYSSVTDPVDHGTVSRDHCTYAACLRGKRKPIQSRFSPNQKSRHLNSTFPQSAKTAPVAVQ